MEATTTPPGAGPAGRPGLAVPLIRNAHWVLGAGLILVALIWMRTDIGGEWSSGRRENIYRVNIMLLYMMVALGLNLVSGYSGAASIGHIGLFAIGGYTEAILTTDYGWHVWPAILVGALVAAAAVAPVGLILLRLSGWYFSIVTLLLVVVVSDLILQQTDLTGGGAGIFGITMPYIGNHQLTQRDYIYLIGGLNAVILLAIRHLVVSSRWGRAFVAVRDAEPAARAVGISPFVVRQSTLLISGFLAGLAGALFAPLPGIVNPDSFPILDSIFFLLAILAGGLGTVSGPVVGTITLYLVPEVIRRQDNVSIAGKELKDYTYMVYGLILLGLVILLPEGVVGGTKRLWNNATGRFLPAGPRPAPVTAATASSAVAIDALAYLRNEDQPDPQNPTTALVCAAVSKRFGDNQALQDVTVQVRAGTIHAVIGPNGSGKTTLLNIVSGFYRNENGRVDVFGRTLPRGRSTVPIRYRVARTFQTPQLAAEMSGLDTVMLGCHARGKSSIMEGLLPLPRVRRERQRFERTAWACLRLVGLGEYQAYAHVASLPFAQRRLLEVARALAGEPRILLLDEPASGLHPEEVRQFADLVRLLRDAGMTIVLVEHNFELVGQLADDITVLDAGRVLAEGTFDEVRANPRVIEAYLGA